jgi:hypothetical protein
MSERVTWVSYAGKQLLQIDFNGCKPGMFAPIIADAQRALSVAPLGSVLALTILSDIRFDPDTVLEMQRFASAAQPFLKANALVGITGLKKVVFNGVKPLYRVPVELFDAVPAAKVWLGGR